MHRRRRNPVIDVAKSATSPATVRTLVLTLVPVLEWQTPASVLVHTLVAVAAAKSVTNAASSAILLVIATKPAQAGTVAGTRTKAATVVEEALVVVPEGAKARLAILVVATATCLAIVHRDKNVTTVSIGGPSPEHFKY